MNHVAAAEISHAYRNTTLVSMPFTVSFAGGVPYSLEISIVAEFSSDLYAGSVVTFDFWIRDNENSLVELTEAAFPVLIYTVNKTGGALGANPIDTLSAQAVLADGVFVPGHYRAVLDTGARATVYLGGLLFAAVAKIPYPAGGQVIQPKVFCLKDPMIVKF